MQPMANEMLSIKMSMAREDSVHHLRDIIETKLLKKQVFDEESKEVRLKLTEADQEVSSLGNLVKKLRQIVDSFTKDT